MTLEELKNLLLKNKCYINNKRVSDIFDFLIEGTEEYLSDNKCILYYYESLPNYYTVEYTDNRIKYMANGFIDILKDNEITEDLECFKKDFIEWFSPKLKNGECRGKTLVPNNIKKIINCTDILKSLLEKI